jgi:hypothetical protein
MDKQKQIEEMASCLVGEVVTGADSTKVLNLGYITVKEIASILVNAGYRKIPDGGCVLNKDQNEKWLDWLELNMSKTRKETAEKFYKKLEERLKNTAYWLFLHQDFEEICKEITWGVE